MRIYVLSFCTNKASTLFHPFFHTLSIAQKKFRISSWDEENIKEILPAIDHLGIFYANTQTLFR